MLPGVAWPLMDHMQNISVLKPSVASKRVAIEKPKPKPVHRELTPKATVVSFSREELHRIVAGQID